MNILRIDLFHNLVIPVKTGIFEFFDDVETGLAFFIGRADDVDFFSWETPC